jgi:hypothetical protein
MTPGSAVPTRRQFLAAAATIDAAASRVDITNG